MHGNLLAERVGRSEREALGIDRNELVALGCPGEPVKTPAPEPLWRIPLGAAKWAATRLGVSALTQRSILD
jgi:hypothetical protein